MDIVRHSVAAFYWRRGEHPASTEQGGARSLLSDRTILILQLALDADELPERLLLGMANPEWTRGM